MKETIVIISTYDSCYMCSTLVLKDNEVVFRSEKKQWSDENVDRKPYLGLKRYLGLQYDFNHDDEKVLGHDHLNDFKEIRKIVDKVIYCEDGWIETFAHIPTSKCDYFKELFERKGD